MVKDTIDIDWNPASSSETERVQFGGGGYRGEDASEFN